MATEISINPVDGMSAISTENFFKNNVLQQEIKKAFSNYRYHPGFDDCEYYLSGVKAQLQNHPELINSTDENGDTLLHKMALYTDENCLIGLRMEEVLAYHPNPFLKNKKGLRASDYLSRNSRYREMLYKYEQECVVEIYHHMREMPRSGR